MLPNRVEKIPSVRTIYLSHRNTKADLLVRQFAMTFPLEFLQPMYST